MKVKHLITELQALDPEEQIIAAFWTEDFLINDFDLSPAKAKHVIHAMQGYDWHDVNEVIYDIADEDLYV